MFAQLASFAWLWKKQTFPSLSPAAYHLNNSFWTKVMENTKPICPVCSTTCSLLDVVDFNKSCHENQGHYLELAGIPVYYALCPECGFCFAPQLHKWPPEKFEELIYNAVYALIDPEYKEVRPKRCAGILLNYFPNLPPTVRHLDYGGGNGLLSKCMIESNWQSVSHDVFVNKETKINQLGKFDLISAFEVFEHVPDVQQLMSDLSTLLNDEGIVIFTTLVTDGNIRPNNRLNWWYASPRNGHISLFSKKSLAILADKYGFKFGSFSAANHMLFKKLPSWATKFAVAA